jgi:hypothetical protein
MQVHAVGGHDVCLSAFLHLGPCRKLVLAVGTQVHRDIGSAFASMLACHGPPGVALFTRCSLGQPEAKNKGLRASANCSLSSREATRP